MNAHPDTAPPSPAPEAETGVAAAAPEERQIQVHLRKIPLLADLSDEEIITLKTELRFRHYTKREVVLHKGGSGDGLLFLLSGQLQVIDVTEDGRAIGLRMLAPGDFFGEIALINNSTRSASVIAMSDVLVAFLPAPVALRLFSHSPSVANQMLRHLAQKIQRDSEFRALLSINNTARRIYTYLVLMQKKTPEGQTVENLPRNFVLACSSTGRRSRASFNPNLKKSGVSCSALATCVPISRARSPALPVVGRRRAFDHSSKLRSITAAMRSSLSAKCQ
ncbi:MAG: Crp/Fnr family transcriptional regulator [Sphingomonadaceae bacterium]